MPPPTPSSTPSASSCCTTRRRLAPSAPRSAISLARPWVRTSIRLARLAQAMSRTRATAPSRRRSAGLASPDEIVLQRHDQRAPVLVVGGILLRRAAARSCRDRPGRAPRVTPGLSFAIAAIVVVVADRAILGGPGSGIHTFISSRNDGLRHHADDRVRAEIEQQASVRRFRDRRRSACARSVSLSSTVSRTALAILVRRERLARRPVQAEDRQNVDESRG